MCLFSIVFAFLSQTACRKLSLPRLESLTHLCTQSEHPPWGWGAHTRAITSHPRQFHVLLGLQTHTGDFKPPHSDGVDTKLTLLQKTKRVNGNKAFSTHLLKPWFVTIVFL